MGPSVLDLVIYAEDTLGVFVDYTPDLPAGVHGAWLPHLDLIVLADGLHPTRERCTLAHELGHAHYRHPACRGDVRLERQADRWAANLLISPAEYELAERLYGPHPGALARELGVTTHLVRVWRNQHRRTS